MPSGYINLPAGASPRWKAPVANAAALPAINNTAGDVRVALDTQNIYIWDGTSAWALVASPGAASAITALIGDATAMGPGAAVVTLATVNSNVGSFGSASSVATFTVNGKGLITAAGSTAIQIAESQVTNLVSDLAGKLGTTLASANIFVGNGSNVATGVAVTGDLSISNAGVMTIVPNAVTNAKFRQSAALSLVGRAGNTTGDVADIAAASDFQIMRRSGTAIAFGSIDLSQAGAVGSSILGLANGGTGASAFAANRIPYSNGTALTSASNLTYTAVSSTLGLTGILSIGNTVTDLVDQTVSGFISNFVINPAADAGTTDEAVGLDLSASSQAGNSHTIRVLGGIRSIVTHNGSGAIDAISAHLLEALSNSSGNITQLVGLSIGVGAEASSSATATATIGLAVSGSGSASSFNSDLYIGMSSELNSMDVNAQAIACILGDMEPSGATDFYGLFVNGSNQPNFIEGRLGINMAVPDHRLHIDSDSDVAVRLDGSGNVSTTVGAAGAAAALPAQPLGYLIINLGGTNVKIPYYNA